MLQSLPDVMYVTRSSCEMYQVSFIPSGWAVFFLDNRTGCMSIQSDWGEFSHCWTHHGCKSLKHFLAKVSPSYLAEKLCYGRPELGQHFYADKSLDKLKRLVLKKRRRKEITALEALNAWEEIDDIRGSDIRDSSYFMCQVMDTCDLFEVVLEKEPMDIPLVVDIHPKVLAFVSKAWPAFANVLKKEIEDDREVSATEAR